MLGRRWILTQTGRGAIGIAVLGFAGCSDANEPADKAADPTSGSPRPPSRRSPPAESEISPPAESGTAEAPGGLAWSRVNLGFVAAYVLVRGREAAIVDTGDPGSVDAIGTILDKAGPGWAGVRHVVLTHKHQDHAGSIRDVLTEAPRATGYVGAADLVEVDAARRLRPLDDGDDVFGLQIVATPGHTAGHVAVFDQDTGVLVAGDALTNAGGLTGSNPRYTEDEAAAVASVRKLAKLRPGTILVGHGDPVVDRAAAALAQLAESLA